MWLTCKYSEILGYITIESINRKHYRSVIAPCIISVIRLKSIIHSTKNISQLVNCYWTLSSLKLTRQVTRATHVRNRVCPRVELILKIIIILLIIFLGFIKSKPNEKNIVPCTGFEP